MPVKGLSERLRLPRRGKIHLGEKRISERTGKEYPYPLEYFVVPEEVKKIYGDKPRQLDVMLPMENRNIFFPQWFKMYGATHGLICKGDGETAVRINQDGEFEEIQCLGRECEFFQGKEVGGRYYQCRIVGSLQIILPKVQGLGIYQIDTSSRNSIINLNSCIEMIRGMMGKISWIPLKLEIGKQTVYPVIKGKKTKKTVNVMMLTAELTVEELLRKRTEILKKIGTPKVVEIENPKVNEKSDLLYPTKEEKETAEKEEESQKTIPKDDLEKKINNLREELLNREIWATTEEWEQTLAQFLTEKGEQAKDISELSAVQRSLLIERMQDMLDQRQKEVEQGNLFKDK